MVVARSAKTVPTRPNPPNDPTERPRRPRPAQPAEETAEATARPLARPHSRPLAPTLARAHRPVLLVLAGVNGAGKSSIGGQVMLRRAGLTWFNPDAYSRLLAQAGVPQTAANARAWQHGVDLLDQAVAAGHAHAFETTLGGETIGQRIAAAAASHDVLMWFCGLATPEQHLARVAARVRAGGHDIPEPKVRERWVQAPLNLIRLMPLLAELKVFDNSSEAQPGSPVPDPALVLHVRSRAVVFPQAVQDLARTPAWAKPIVQAARDLESRI
jgi:predicted ABC-type ATPase